MALSAAQRARLLRMHALAASVDSLNLGGPAPLDFVQPAECSMLGRVIGSLNFDQPGECTMVGRIEPIGGSAPVSFVGVSAFVSGTSGNSRTNDVSGLGLEADDILIWCVGSRFGSPVFSFGAGEGWSVVHD